MPAQLTINYYEADEGLAPHTDDRSVTAVQHATVPVHTTCNSTQYNVGRSLTKSSWDFRSCQPVRWTSCGACVSQDRTMVLRWAMSACAMDFVRCNSALLQSALHLLLVWSALRRCCRGALRWAFGSVLCSPGRTLACVCACVCLCARVCVRSHVRACMRSCVRTRACVIV
jgi:hypothetical protein